MGYENEKAFATITTSKEEVDYQFWYPGRNRVIKEYKNIKDNDSWKNEDDGELVYSIYSEISMTREKHNGAIFWQVWGGLEK